MGPRTWPCRGPPAASPDGSRLVASNPVAGSVRPRPRTWAGPAPPPVAAFHVVKGIFFTGTMKPYVKNVQFTLSKLLESLPTAVKSGSRKISPFPRRWRGAPAVLCSAERNPLGRHLNVDENHPRTPASATNCCHVRDPNTVVVSREGLYLHSKLGFSVKFHDITVFRPSQPHWDAVRTLMTLQKPRDINLYLAGLGDTGSQPIMPKNLPETLIPGTKRSAKVSTSLQPPKNKIKMPVRTLSIHHRLRNGQAGRSSSRPGLCHCWRRR